MIKKKEADQVLACLIKSSSKEYPDINGKTIIEIMDAIKRYNDSKIKTTNVLVKRNIFGFPVKVKHKSLFYDPNIDNTDHYEAFGLNQESVEKQGENLAVLFLKNSEPKTEKRININSLIDFINKNQELKFYLMLKFVANPFYVFDQKTVDNAKLRIQELNK